MTLQTMLAASCCSATRSAAASISRLLPATRPLHMARPEHGAARPSPLSDLLQLPRGPAPALGLGLAGLTPFLAAPLYMQGVGLWLPGVAAAQLSYGAVILSFLGGVRWGLLVSGDLPPTWSAYTLSVAPSLLGWAALLSPSLPAGLVACSAGLLAAASLDCRQPAYPPWFRALRLLLSLAAVTSLLACLVLSQSLATKQQPSDILT